MPAVQPWVSEKTARIMFMHLTEKFEYNASEGVKGMDIEKITGELERSGKADKLRELADSEDCRALGAMLDAATVAKAVASGDSERDRRHTAPGAEPPRRASAWRRR